jgi:2',3'-cyclic-nucleotide 2'-phosphodiesterase (5'-nucleotidase family)
MSDVRRRRLRGLAPDRGGARARRSRRRGSTLLVLLVLSGSLGCASSGRPPARSGRDLGMDEAMREGASGGPELTILYFNDLHGHLVPFTRQGDSIAVGGAARMATLIRRVREENAQQGRPTLLLNGGDVFQGTPLSTVFKGEPDFKFMNMVGVDAMVLGNHEFDFGLDVLQRRMSEADFPILGANVRRKNGGAAFTTPYVLRTLTNGVRVGIMGMVTDDTPETTDPINVTPLVFVDPLVTAARFVPALDDSADIILLVSHSGVSKDRETADEFEDIDVIVGGHDQILIPRPMEEDDVLITQAEGYGLYLGRLDLEVDGDEVKLLSDTLYAITDEIPDDPQIAAMVETYTRRLDEELDKPIGVLATPLEGERKAVRTRPSNFGQLLCRIMQQRTGADLAVINSGGIRSSIDAGPVTLGEIIQALPFINHIMTVELSGSEIEGLLAFSLEQRKRTDSGGFLQVTGLTFEDSPAGPRSIRIDGEPVDPFKLYRIAHTDFLYRGGDGYAVFARLGRDPTDTGTPLADALADYIREHSPLSVPGPE